MQIKIHKTVPTLAMLILLAVVQLQVQHRLNQYKAEEGEFFLYLPKGDHLKPLALGYDQVLADLLWIQTIDYFGDHYVSDQKYPWLYHMLTLIIDLDPRFDFPYYFGGIVLSLEASQREHANEILERGIQAYPEKWEYPFYIGFNHYYHEGNPETAIPYLERAAALPKAPEFITSMVGTLYAKTKSSDTALSFFREAYQNTRDENIRKKIAEKIEKLLAEGESHGGGD